MFVFLVALLTILIHTDKTEGSADPLPDPVPLLDPRELSDSDDNNGLYFIYSHWPKIGHSGLADEGEDDDDDGVEYDPYMKGANERDASYKKKPGSNKYDLDEDLDLPPPGDYDLEEEEEEGLPLPPELVFPDDIDEKEATEKHNNGDPGRTRGSRPNSKNKYAKVPKDYSEEKYMSYSKWDSKEDLIRRWKDDEEYLDNTETPVAKTDDEDCWESGEDRPSKFVGGIDAGLGGGNNQLPFGFGGARSVGGTHTCNFNCDSNKYIPICGSNAKTYNNECFLKEADCMYPDDGIVQLLDHACPVGIEDKLCEYKRCGTHAHCDIELGACKCDEGYVGNPRMGCRDGGKCIGMKCGENARCQISTGICKCLTHYSGNPNERCELINLCEGKTCVNNAYCNKEEGKCTCRDGYEGDPELACTKHSLTSSVEITLELSQLYDKANTDELTKILDVQFCDDLLTTGWEENCEVQHGLNSPYAKYKNCGSMNEPVAGACQVIKISKGREETTTVRMIVIYDCRDIKEQKHDFIKDQIKKIPGLREPMTGEIIWYSRKGSPDTTFTLPLIFQLSKVTIGCLEEGEDATTITKVEDEAECADLLSPHRCEGIKAAFSCDSEPAMQYCAKHCGICTEGQVSKTDCFNMYTSSECATLKRQNKCGITEINLVCEKTCNNCQLNLHKECSDIGSSCFCFRLVNIWGCFNHHLPGRFQNMCRKSCGLC